MVIRKAVPQDYFSISEISQNDLGYECSSELVLYRLSNLDCKRETVFVAEIENNVVGYVHVEVYNVLYFESMVNVLGIAVSSTYRRQGVGRALLNRVEEWANSLNIRKIRLNSGALRTDAHSFYKAMGYNNQKEQIRFIKDLK